MINHLIKERLTILKIVCLFLLFVSCKKESEMLNPVPETSILDANAFDTPERVLGLVNGVYTKVKDPQFYGGKYIMYGDLRGEEFINRTQNIFTGYDTWGHNFKLIPVIRYAEVLLNYAESLAKTGNLLKSSDLLKAVRQRSDGGYVFVSAKTDTQEALVSSILLERRIEFLGEGLRSNDLLRNLMTIPAKGSSSLLAPAVTPAQASYIFPLPYSEILTNKLLL